MSRQNKVNPDHYKVGGRLTPDELGRERQKQQIRTAKPGRSAPAAGRRRTSRDAQKSR